MHVYIYTSAYVYNASQTFIHTHTHTHVCAYVPVCVYMCVYTCVCIHVCVYMCVPEGEEVIGGDAELAIVSDI